MCSSSESTFFVGARARSSTRALLVRGSRPRYRVLVYSTQSFHIIAPSWPCSRLSRAAAAAAAPPRMLLLLLLPCMVCALLLSPARRSHCVRSPAMVQPSAAPSPALQIDPLIARLLQSGGPCTSLDDFAAAGAGLVVWRRALAAGRVPEFDGVDAADKPWPPEPLLSSLEKRKCRRRSRRGWKAR